MDWLRRILGLFGGRSDGWDDDRRPSGIARDARSSDDSVPRNAPGSPDDRDEAERANGDDGDDDDGGSDDGGSDD